jgi:hypothetical protein
LSPEFTPEAQRYTAAVRTLVTYAGWWVASFWLWIAYQGEWNKVEWVAAACAATLAAAFATLVAHHGLLRYRVPTRALAEGANVPLQIVVDFAIVTRALVRRLLGHETHGAFVVRSLPSAGSGATAAGDRAARGILATYSPNAYVIDLDAANHTVLLHDLVPNRNSEKPA